MDKTFAFKYLAVPLIIATAAITLSLNNDKPITDVDNWGVGVSQGLVSSSVGTEISGVISSRQYTNVLWVHNDSGDSARIYAVSTKGEHLATVNLVNVNAFDYEDIAIDAQNRIYVADIGDNAMIRDSVQIYRFAEPVNLTDTIDITPEVITLTYPDGSHNAETFMVDPINGDLFILTKTDKGNSILFKAKSPISSGTTLIEVQSIDLNNELTTAGDISPNGNIILVRTYDHLYAWYRTDGISIERTLTTPPLSWPVQGEQQGEAVGFSANGKNYFTISEGNTQPIYFYPIAK